VTEYFFMSFSVGKGGAFPVQGPPGATTALDSGDQNKPQEML